MATQFDASVATSKAQSRPRPGRKRTTAAADTSSPPADGDHPDQDEDGAPAQGSYDPPTDQNPPPGESSPGSDDNPEDPRRVAHELVALAHAVLSIAGREDVLPVWCPEDVRQSVRDSAGDFAQAVGLLHAEIATGTHDAGLLRNGIGGPPGKPKRKLFRRVDESEGHGGRSCCAG